MIAMNLPTRAVADLLVVRAVQMRGSGALR